MPWLGFVKLFHFTSLWLCLLFVHMLHCSSKLAIAVQHTIKQEQPVKFKTGTICSVLQW